MDTPGCDEDELADVIDIRAGRRGDTAALTVDRQEIRHWTIVTVDGEMDRQAVPLLPSLTGRIAPHIVMVLAGVTFTDVSAIRALVHMQHQAVESGGCVRLVAPSTSVLKVLLLTGMVRVFTLYDGLARALATPVPVGPERPDDGARSSCPVCPPDRAADRGL